MSFEERWDRMTVVERIAYIRADWQSCQETHDPLVLRIASAVAHDVCRQASDEIERLRAGGCARDQRTTQYCAEAARLQAERDAFKAQADDVVEVEIDDIERVIKAAKSLGKDSIKLSARDLWRMANDKRGREAEDEEWEDD